MQPRSTIWSKAKPVYWAPPNLWARPTILTMVDLAEAQGELQALEHHAIKDVVPVPKV